MKPEKFFEEMQASADLCAEQATDRKGKFHRIACLSLATCIFVSGYVAVAGWILRYKDEPFYIVLCFMSGVLNLFVGLGARRSGYKAEAEFLILRAETLGIMALARAIIAKAEAEDRQLNTEGEEWKNG